MTCTARVILILLQPRCNTPATEIDRNRVVERNYQSTRVDVWGHTSTTAASLFLVVRLALQVPVADSITLWFAGVVLYLFFATALGIFLGTTSRSMAQFALLIILVIVLQLLSGGSTPVESQPKWLQSVTYFLPSRHFVSFSQVIICRGGGITAVWRQFL